MTAEVIPNEGVCDAHFFVNEGVHSEGFLLELDCTRTGCFQTTEVSLARAWDRELAAPSLNRTAAVCVLPTTLREAQLFNSPGLRRPRRTHGSPPASAL